MFLEKKKTSGLSVYTFFVLTKSVVIRIMRMRKKWVNLALLSLLSITSFSCLEKLGAQLPPLNTRKLKKKVRPPEDFNLLVLSYKRDHGYWPKSEMDLIAFNRPVVNKLYDAGFNSWTLGAFSEDTLYIHFVHEPVFENAHFGGISIPGKEVKIRTLYVSSQGMVKTDFDK